MNPGVNVETGFAALVRDFGGAVVEDTVGPSPRYPNADYLFRSDGVVAELKRLVDDKSEDDKLKAKVRNSGRDWQSVCWLPEIFGPAAARGAVTR